MMNRLNMYKVIVLSVGLLQLSSVHAQLALKLDRNLFSLPNATQKETRNEKPIVNPPIIRQKVAVEPKAELKAEPKVVTTPVEPKVAVKPSVEPKAVAIQKPVVETPKFSFATNSISEQKEVNAKPRGEQNAFDYDPSFKERLERVTQMDSLLKSKELTQDPRGNKQKELKARQAEQQSRQDEKRVKVKDIKRNY